MNITELEMLTNIANNNEDVLNNKTSNLRDEIRDWCIEELRKIEAEEKKLLDFVNANKSVFCDKCGTPLFYSFGMCYSKIGDMYSNSRIFTHLELDRDKINFKGFDPYFQSASVHNWTTKVQGCYDCMNGTVEYWTKMKRCVDFRRFQLKEMTNKLGQLVQSVIESQKSRMNDVVEACKEIDEDNTKTIEIKVKVRV